MTSYGWTSTVTPGTSSTPPSLVSSGTPPTSGPTGPTVRFPQVPGSPAGTPGTFLGTSTTHSFLPRINRPLLLTRSRVTGEGEVRRVVYDRTRLRCKSARDFSETFGDDLDMSDSRSIEPQTLIA